MSTDPAFTPVTSLLARRARNHPQGTPLGVDGGTWLTFEEWETRSNTVARGLCERGVRRGDRIGLLFAGMDWFDYVVGYFGVLKAGATATHLCDLLGVDEVRRRLGHAAAVGLIHGSGLAAPDTFDGWTAQVRQLESSDTTPVAVQIGPEDICDILYTSGTTGPAKPLLNPHGNVSFGRGWSALAEDIFDQSRPLLSPLPIGTAYSAGTAGAFAVGTTAPILVSPPDDTERMARLVERHRVGSVMVRPRAAMRWVRDEVNRRYDLSSVTVLGVASGPLPSRYGRALRAMLPDAVIATAYGGGSEAVPAHIRARYDPARPGYLGSAQPGTELRITDAAGTGLPAGQIGEIRVRTPAPRRRYLDPAAGAGVFVDGWIRTGDLGYLDAAGELYFFDRGEDAIATPEGLVSSLAVENALYELPDIDAAAVVGVPGPDGHARVVAAVTLLPGASRPDFDRLLEDLLPAHARPGVVHVLDALPRNTISDKVLKVELRRRLVAPAGVA